jgi:hypothetical protein
MGLECQRQLARHVQRVARIPRHTVTQLFVELGQIRVNLHQLKEVIVIITRIPRHADAQLFVELGQIRVDLYQLEKVVGINDPGQG